MNIHSTAIVDPKAELAEGVQIGPYVIIGSDVVIGKNTEIMAHTCVHPYTTIGSGCRIYPSVSVGADPQDLKFKRERTDLVIGDNTTIREFATLHRGTSDGGGKTTVGSNCFLMAYVHVAHDCHVGNDVILANNLAMAGHVTIENGASIGGMVAIHQFTRIGEHAYIGGYSRISKDVPPYMLGEGAVDFNLHGPNVIGLKRKGFSPEAIGALKDAFRMIFRNRRPLAQVLEETTAAFPNVPEVKNLVDFISSSKRGVYR